MRGQKRREQFVYFGDAMAQAKRMTRAGYKGVKVRRDQKFKGFQVIFREP